MAGFGSRVHLKFTQSVSRATPVVKWGSLPGTWSNKEDSVRQGLVAWLLMGVLALTAFDAFETIKTPVEDAAVTESDTQTAGRDGAMPPPGN